MEKMRYNGTINTADRVQDTKTYVAPEHFIDLPEDIQRAMKLVAFMFDSNVYLFGSYAAGRHHANSDLDLFVISTMNRNAATERANRQLDLGIKLDVVPITDDTNYKELICYRRQ